jgi:aryl-alcohol dehydrogenase-like predicted oxidoreductase
MKTRKLGDLEVSEIGFGCLNEDVASTVKDLIKEGKVVHFGLSEASAK